MKNITIKTIEIVTPIILTSYLILIINIAL